ncbi:MAG: hypothetical protein ACM31D_09195 [Bacteroidota bacterium]
MTEPSRKAASWWSRLTAKAAIPADVLDSKTEVKTDHIRRAVVVIGGFLALICLIVLVKGILGAPRLPRHAENTASASPPANPEAGLSAYQEKLQQYRQTRSREAASGSTGVPSSPEDAQFVKQQLRLPMLVKDALPSGVVTATPPEAPDPVVRSNPALEQRLGELHKRLAELRDQQQKAGGTR